MAALVKPVVCEHQKVQWNPITLEDAPPGQMPKRNGHGRGHFLRQIGKCHCGHWVVRVTDITFFGPARVLRGLVRGVDPR